MPTTAQPPLAFIPPQFNPWVMRGVRWLLPLLRQRQTAIATVEADNLEAFARLYAQFERGETRLLLAFRHPSVDDPVCLFELMHRLLPRAARRYRIPLRGPTHFHFLYDRGIPLWAGERVGWLYSRLGGISILRGKLDLVGLRTAREVLVSGRFPLAAAPEGATNGHNEILSPIEPGVAQLGVWAVEDLQKQGRSAEVLIVPIGIRYHYVEEPWEAIADLLAQLERDCGLSVGGTVNPGPSPELSPELSPASFPTAPGDRQGADIAARLYPRLLALADHLLQRMEAFYQQFYPSQSGPLLEQGEVSGGEARRHRLQRLLQVALGVAEEYFGVAAKGSVIDRCRRLEQAGWDRIYRQDLGELDRLSPLERGLADRIAEEADLRLWHMRLVESFVAVTGSYVHEKPTAERFAELLLLLWDLMVRLRGGNPFQRPQLGPRKAVLTLGEPLSVTAAVAGAAALSAPGHTGGRRASRQAVETLTQQLQDQLQRMIDPVS